MAAVDALSAVELVALVLLFTVASTINLLR